MRHRRRSAPGRSVRGAGIALLVVAVTIAALLPSAALADKPTPQPPATTNTVNPGNACNTPANGKTTGFGNPPSVTTGVPGEGTPPLCRGAAEE